MTNDIIPAVWPLGKLQNLGESDHDTFRALGLLTESQYQIDVRNQLGPLRPFVVPDPPPEACVDDRYADYSFEGMYMCWWSDGACTDQDDDQHRRCAGRRR